MNVPSSAVTISPILVLTYVSIVFMKITNGIIQSLKQQCGLGDYPQVDGFSSDCYYWTRGAAGSRRWSPWLSFSFLKTVTVPVAIYDSFLPCPFYSTHIPMFTVLDPLLEFTYHLLFSWSKFALCIQSLLCMLFLFGWPPCQRSDMILMEVSQHAYDMIKGLIMDGCVLLTSTPECVVSPRGETTHEGVDVNNTHPSMINPDYNMILANLTLNYQYFAY